MIRNLALWLIMLQKYDTTLIWLCMFSLWYRNAILLLFLLFHEDTNFFHEHDYQIIALSFISRFIPYNHIDVLYHVKIQTNGPCLHASFVRVESAMFGHAWNKGAAFEGVVFAARAGTLILHPYDSTRWSYLI